MAAVTPALPPIAAGVAPAPGERGPRAQPGLTGMWIAVATISMSFAALTSALVVRQSSGPPGDWRHFELPSILFVNTAVLLASSISLEWARRSRLAAGLYLTLMLGLVFVAGQVMAWRALGAQGLFLATAPSAAFFYVFTALHAMHVLGGLTGIGYVLRRPAAIGVAALYWHFMAVLWIYLLLLLASRV